MAFAAETPAAYDVREHYTKYEYQIPMRDGVRLFTSVLVPKDASTQYPPERSTPAATTTSAAETRDVGPPTITLAGYQQLVRGEPFRGKYRNSFEKPEPFVPGKVEAVNFTMPDVNHTFRRGHRIMVQVQSSWFPLVDRNPQTFVNIPTAKPEDFRVATQRVMRTQAQPSGVEVLVLPQNGRAPGMTSAAR